MGAPFSLAVHGAAPPCARQDNCRRHGAANTLPSTTHAARAHKARPGSQHDTRIERPAMSMVASFEIGYTRYLAPPGEPPSPTSPPPPFASDPDALLPLYQAMVLTRQFDLK